MAKRFLRSEQIITPPQANATGFSTYSPPAGHRIHMANWKLRLPAGKTVTDCVGKVRMTLGGDIQDLDVMDLDRIRGIEGPGQGILNNVPGGIATIPMFLSEPARKSTQSVESGALDLIDGAPRAVFALEFKSLAAPPTLGLELLVEPLGEIPKSQWNLDSQGRLLVTKIRKNPINTSLAHVVDENFQAFQTDRLLSMHISKFDGPTAVLTAGVLNEVHLLAGGVRIFDRTKQSVDAEMTQYEMNPGSNFDVIPSLGDRNSDGWNLNGLPVALHLYFTDALGGPGNEGVTATAAAGGVNIITVHRGTL